MRVQKRRDFLASAATLVAAMSAPKLTGANAMSRKPASMRFDEYVTFDAMGLAELVSKGEVSAQELLEIAIARSAQVNGTLNAINLPYFDLARDAIKAGLAEGPLTGVPWLLKDLHMKLKGTRTTYGSQFFADYTADYNSTLVDRYQQAGLVIFGKTHSPEFGGTATTESALWGDTLNPWNLEHSSGGSSGGSSAAVSAGILPAANASDGGGSIRIPASCCGLFGMKPTRARTPLGPDRFEGGNGQSVVHAVTRSVRDSALILDISQGSETGAPYHAPAPERPYLEELTREPGKLRIALMAKPIVPMPVHAECSAAVDEAARLCERLGHEVVEAAPAVPVKEYYEAVGVISAVGALATVTAREKVLGRKVTREDLEPITFARAQQGRSITGLQYAQARRFFHQMGAVLGQFHTQYDLILSPTMASPPAKIGELSLRANFESYQRAAVNASVFTHLFNVTGQPAMSVPLYWSASGLPIGVMFAARFGDEATLFRLAAQLEQAQPWFGKMPDMNV
ncbi:MAG: amidase [Pseudomonadales bacterium]